MLKVRKNSALYLQLKELDAKLFYGCDDEFQPNRDWWVMLDDSQSIIAYCACLYKDKICVFVRAWVVKHHRGNGYHKQLIKVRVKEAVKKRCKSIVRYTLKNNYASANNLIKAGFLLHNPQYAYAGTDVLYFLLNITNKQSQRLQN